jgi:hypothetical protein
VIVTVLFISSLKVNKTVFFHFFLFDPVISIYFLANHALSPHTSVTGPCRCKARFRCRWNGGKIAKFSEKINFLPLFSSQSAFWLITPFSDDILGCQFQRIIGDTQHSSATGPFRELGSCFNSTVRHAYSLGTPFTSASQGDNGL